MAALFPVRQRTLDIDGALLEVYGLDQFGLDSAWRTFMGLEPLPSPDELATQLGESSASPAEDTPGDNTEDSGDTPASGDATAMPENTPEAEEHVARAAVDGDEEPEGGSNSPGCSVASCG